MKYLKLIQYAYLVCGFLFLYKAYEEYTNEKNPILYLAFGAAAIGMFFFRRNFHNKYQNRNNK